MRIYIVYNLCFIKKKNFKSQKKKLSSKNHLFFERRLWGGGKAFFVKVTPLGFWIFGITHQFVTHPKRPWSFLAQNGRVINIPPEEGTLRETNRITFFWPFFFQLLYATHSFSNFSKKRF